MSSIAPAVTNSPHRSAKWLKFLLQFFLAFCVMFFISSLAGELQNALGSPTSRSTLATFMTRVWFSFAFTGMMFLLIFVVLAVAVDQENISPEKT
ncbi:MAG TPA: hypothetical protein VEH04_06040 [Verrucomicrobiae bacterium]|nr:hypothetical protein [Verrucomicrobiae bacterium]